MRCLILSTIALNVALQTNGVGNLALAQPSSAPPESRDRPPYVDVAMIADTPSVVPGRPFRLGLIFDIKPGWHIYWKHSGETGQPTRVEWVLPTGFETGPLMYPAPHKFVDKSDIVSFGHEGKVLLWTEVTPSETLKSGKMVKLSGRANWLACKTLCVIGKKDVSLQLPVSSRSGDVKSPNEKLFDDARRQTPVPPDRAGHVRVETGMNVDRVRPRDRFEVGVHLTIAPGAHIQSHTPLDKALIATDLFLGGPDVIDLGRPVFPAGKVREFLGAKVSEYAGQVLIRVPARATADLKPGEVHVDGVLVVQACLENGACLPPQYIAVDIPLMAVVADASIQPANPEWFGSSPEPTSRQTASLDRSPTEPPSRAGESTGLGFLLLLALAGGLVLNVMPCVLPVISIKILSFVQQAGEEPRRVLILGMSFVLGMLVFFLGLGVLAMFVPVGPGWLLQRPEGVIILAALIFGFALSLFGVFEVRLPGGAAAQLGQTATREGPPGAFAKGFLTTILGTSCTAPFLSYAWAGALTVGPAARLLIFGTMGVGMALPYMVLSAKPAWMKFLPRPGPWMDGFKQFMGFLLVATVLWLLWVLAGHVGAEGVVLTLVFLTILSLGLWVVGRVPLNAGPARSWVTYAAAVAIVLMGAVGLHPRLRTLALTETDSAAAPADPMALTAIDFTESIPWQTYRPGLAEEIAASGKVVYVDYTARWCLTCQSNKRLVLETQAVRDAMQRLGVVPIRADFTALDPDMKRELARYNRPSVPLNLVYGPGRADNPIVLPELLTRERVLGALKEAASLPPDGE